MTYIEKTSYFEVAPPGHTIAYKNVDNNLLKIVSIYSNLLCNLQIWCLRNVHIFIDVS